MKSGRRAPQAKGPGAFETVGGNTVQFLVQLSRTARTLGHIAFSVRPVASRLLLSCSVLLGFRATAAADPFPSPIPAWYSNTTQQQVPFYCLGGANCSGTGSLGGVSSSLGAPSFPSGNPSLQIVWKNSYVFQAPGDEALYWYAQVLYRNIGTELLFLKCYGPVLADKPVTADKVYIREVMSGTPDSGYVDADETLCKKYPDFRRILHPGETHYDWAIFHNVPWNRAVAGAENSVVSLAWGPYGPSDPAYPWSSSISKVSPPAECPSELVSLGTCNMGQPQGGNTA